MKYLDLVLGPWENLFLAVTAVCLVLVLLHRLGVANIAGFNPEANYLNMLETRGKKIYQPPSV